MENEKLLKTYTILQLVLTDETGDSYYRMRWPARELHFLAPKWRILNLDARSRERFDWAEHADLLVLYQSHDLDLLPIIQKRRAAGKKTLVEYNDNFYSPPAATPVADAWSSPILWQAYERFMQEADGVTVTGVGLAELFSKRTSKPIHILENHIPRSRGGFQTLWEQKGEEIRLGVAGSLGHMADFLAIADVLRETLQTFPQVKLHIMGNESLPALLRVPENRVRFTPWGSMEQYFLFWESVHIGIAPLIDTPYNRCRSDVKALEMAACGVAPIITNLLPYQKFIAKTSCLNFSSFLELQEALAFLIQNPATLREQAERCYQYVERERLGSKQKERLELYSSLLPDRPSSLPALAEWPYPAGIFEINGTLQDSPLEANILQTAQKHLNEKQKEKALSLIQGALTTNQFLPGLALAELKILANVIPAAEWLVKARDYSRRFPADLRFALLLIRTEGNAEVLRQSWQQLAVTLRNESKPFRNFFRSSVLQTLNEQMRSFPQLHEVAQEFLEFYPNDAKLHFMLAQAYEEHGIGEKAILEWSWLLEAKEASEQNQETLKGLERNYLATIREAVATRNRRSLVEKE